MASATLNESPVIGSDLHQPEVMEQTPKKASKQILRQEIEEGLGAAVFAGLAALIGSSLGVIDPRVFGEIEPILEF